MTNTNARRALKDYERSFSMPSNTATASASSGGISIFGLAFIAMLVFKLADMGGATWGLDIPWLVVFLPLILGFGLFFLVLFIILLIAIVSK